MAGPACTFANQSVCSGGSRCSLAPSYPKPQSFQGLRLAPAPHLRLHLHPAPCLTQAEQRKGTAVPSRLSSFWWVTSREALRRRRHRNTTATAVRLSRRSTCLHASRAVSGPPGHGGKFFESQLFDISVNAVDTSEPKIFKMCSPTRRRGCHSWVRRTPSKSLLPRNAPHATDLERSP